MAITLSDEAIAELKSGRPQFKRVLKIAKRMWNSDERVMIDRSDQVASWGRYVCPSTFGAEDWELPNLTLSLKNVENELNPYYSGCWFDQSPATHFRDCVVIVVIYILKGERREPEYCLVYTGAIEDVIPKYDQDFSMIEIVTICYQGRQLSRYLKKADGERLYIPYNTYTPPGVP